MHSILLKVLIFENLKYRFSLGGVPKSEGCFVIGVPKAVLFINSAEYSSLTTKETQYLTENTQQHSELQKSRQTGIRSTVFHEGYPDSKVKISSRLWAS